MLVDRRLGYRCPACNRALAKVPGMVTATQVVTRKCRCGARWQIKVEPRPIAGGKGFVDTGTFLRIA